MKKRILVESIFKALLLASVAQTAMAGGMSGMPRNIQNGFALNPGEVMSGGTNASSLSGGLPVVLATGNMVYSETDFHSAEDMGLFLTRTYNYQMYNTGIFGSNWISNFDYHL